MLTHFRINAPEYFMNHIIKFYYFAVLCAILISCSDNSAFTSTTNLSDGKDSLISANDGVEIFYSQAGNGDQTLFFVHGWCINQTYWKEQIAIFSENYKTVAIDLPGFGKSGKD